MFIKIKMDDSLIEIYYSYKIKNTENLNEELFIKIKEITFQFSLLFELLIYYLFWWSGYFCLSIF